MDDYGFGWFVLCDEEAFYPNGIKRTTQWKNDELGKNYDVLFRKKKKKQC